MEQKNEDKQKRPSVTNIFLIGIGTAVVGYSLYEFYQRVIKKDDSTPDADLLLQEKNTVTKPVTTRNDRFPLKKGSLGTNVRLMQTGLQKILGEDVISKLTPIDGDYGSGTEKALIQAGFPTVVDESTFMKIIQGSGTITTDSLNPKTIAEQLYNQVVTKNLNGVLMALRQLKSVADYSTISPAYKVVTEEKTGTTYTLVTHLLNKAGFDGASKEKIREEFRRIGLIEKSDGSWSLSGIRIYKDIQTLANTFVTDSTGITILVDKGTILGEELKVSNGMTTFKALDGHLYAVPTRDVIQVR
ncbi:MAG TPA: hypothetical protein VNB90_15060 [Cytophagaceae bacterium]|jgi:hypothetical protein|nr:hypothetical protein [Cytophagaceae bacterium]